jgi:hypothetical protein
LPVGFVKGGVQQQTETGDFVERNENSSSSSERYIYTCHEYLNRKNFYFSFMI